MKKIFLSVLLLTIVVIGSLAKSTLIATIPEPAIMLLFGTGLVGIAGIIRRKTKR